MSLISCCVSFAQSTWQLDDYSKWDYTNFRQNNIFYQPFSTFNPDYLLLDAALFYMTNEERSKVGVPELRYHKLLEVAAYNHSMKMATTNFFSHENSVDHSRFNPSDRGKLAGVSNPSFAENIAYNYPENGSSYLQVATKLMVQWMNSPGHKDNILSIKARQMGAGTYYYDRKIYGTQVFQWFNDVNENANGGDLDQLPKPITMSDKTNNAKAFSKTNSTSITTNENTPKPQTNISNSLQVELNELKNKVAQLSSLVSEKDGTIAKLNREISTLKNENYRLDAAKTNMNNLVNTLQDEKLKKDTQKQKLQNESNLSSDKKTSEKNSKLTFKIGLNTFYPNINPINLGNFNMNLLSFGAETMLGVNFGEANRSNSLGVTFRANQTNRFLTQALDSRALQPIQYYDAELTAIIRGWLSIGSGATFISAYGSSTYQIKPSASIGLYLGPKNWKIQLTQQVYINSDQNIIGRASIGIALKL